jgi:hypothetical protein
MGKINLRKGFVNVVTKKANLKTGIAVLIAAMICGWAAYKLLNPRMTERYNNFAADSAVDWLESADREKFDACRKDIADGDGWFNLYMRDRKSLGKIKSRGLSSSQELPAVNSGLKRYELKFASSFSESPKDVLEQLIVESDNRSRFTVINAGYWLYNFRPNKTGVSLTEDEKQRIKVVAEDVLKKVDARETTFFKQAYAEWAKHPDYFHWKSWIAAEAKSGKTIASLYEILSKGKSSPWKFIGMNAFAPIGRAGFECGSVYYSFSVNSEGKSRNFTLSVAIDRDLYADKNAEWKFFGLWFREIKVKKK